MILQIIGKTLTLNRTAFTVIGVARQGFTGTILGGNPSGWVPMAMHDVVQPNFDWYEQRRGLFLFTFGRLKPEASVEQASARAAHGLRRARAGVPRRQQGTERGRRAARSRRG